jgi:hypothetical protein
MRVVSIRTSIFFVGLAWLGCGCAGLKPQPWPVGRQRYQPFHFTPAASVEDARDNLRGLAGSMNFRRGRAVYACTHIEFEGYAVALRFEKIGGQPGDPSYQDPAYHDEAPPIREFRGPGGTLGYGTLTKIETVLTLYLDAIDNVALQHFGEVVDFYFPDGGRCQLVADNASAAQEFADNVLTLALARGHQTVPDPGFQLAIGRLSDDQKAALGLDHGVVVGPVETGGAAEQAGVETGDLVLEVDGQAVHSRRDLWARFEKGQPVVLHLRNYTRTRGSDTLEFTAEKTVTVAPTPR